jgi:putative ubiquitin-RnfH superfamily antitoxin RatB of RatAB toxin-antitoxin module
MKVSIAYAAEQVWQFLDIDDESTVEDLILRSGLLKLFPIDLKKQKVGIYGKFTKLDTKLQDGDRVEIYQPITRILDDEDDDDD